jgi:Tol biopolymer transport system component
VGVAAIAFVLADLRRPAAAPENPLANAKFTLLTNWEGAEEGADISPDGKFVAFLSDNEREFDLWLTQVGTGRFSNLTRNIPPLGASGVIVRKLGFSGAASDIWFNSSDGRPLMLMPLTGGPPRPFLREGANTPAWSPDANQIVYVYKPNRDDPMYVADRTGTDRRQILPPGSLKNINPAWSPDGEWIYFVRGAEPQDEIDVDLWRMRAAGGAPERLTEQHAAVNFPTPIDARTVLYVARDDDWSGPWLWAIDVETRQKRRVPTGSEQYTSVAASRDGRRMVATVVNPSASLWRVPLRAGVAGERDADLYPLPVPSSRTLAPRFGGNSLFYLSAHGAGEGLWKITNNEASEVWSYADGRLFEPAVVSPDGSRVAVIVRQQGKRRLSILSADGTNRRALAPFIEIEGAAGQSAADWSPDGRWIVAGGRDAQGPALFKIPVEGAEPVRLVGGNWVNPIWSPTDDLIVYAGRSVVGQVAVHGVRSDGAPMKLPELMVRPGGYRFLRDGSGLVYLPRIQSLDFWVVDFTTRATRQITNLGNHGTLRTFDITPDGKYVVFDRARPNSNIVLIERPSE